MIRVGQRLPNPSVLTTVGLFELHKYLGDSWAIIFSHPKNFAPVCTTEIASLTKLQEEFERREVKIICLGLDKIERHQAWIKDIEFYAQKKIKFPFIADASGEVAEELGMLDSDHKDKQAVRAVYFVTPDQRVKAVINYPSSSGRCYKEVLRILDSLQLHWKRPDVITPADWVPGDKVLVKPGERVPDDSYEPVLPSRKNYMHFINC